VATAKRVIQAGQDADMKVAHAIEQSAFGSISSSSDRREGMDAFLEKRDPSFENR
jgi:enoyl-CoA hydratase